MRKIKFKKLTIQNFLSIGNDTVEINFQNGLNLITGIDKDNPERRNGSGKSVIIEGFYYALFGTTIRDIKKEFVINNSTKGKGRVDLLLDVETDTGTNSYKIVRTLKPSGVELYKLGATEEDISKDSIANTNKYICDLIGSNPVICKSCDILSLSDNTPFMAKKPEDKRKFIEDIFALEIFGLMLKDLKELVKENKSSISIITAKLDEIETSLKALRKQYDDQKTQADHHEEILNKRRFDIEERMDKLDDQLDGLVWYMEPSIISENEKLHKAWEKMDGKLARFKTSETEKKNSKLLIENEIKKLSNITESSCPTCLQEVSETHLEHITKEIDDNKYQLKIIVDALLYLETEIANVMAKKTLVQTKLAENKVKLDHNKLTTEKETSIKTSLDDLSKQLEDLESDIGTKNINLNSFLDLITETLKRQGEQEAELKNLKQTAEDLEVCKFILGEEGIKSFIIKRLLDMLNASIQKYITSLGMTMKCKFDEYFDEQITTDSGQQTTYWNFSGGERRTVDIACAWAFKDIKRKISGVSSNIEFFDEIFDAAFDPVGFDKLIDVLKDRIEKYNLSCYAISHRQETLKHIDGETVSLEKENKITRRIYE
jgi:DNA repair exonuclease SbcCD ATPase subunit